MSRTGSYAARMRVHHGLPVLAACVVLSLSGALSVALQRRENRETERAVALKARSLATLLLDRLGARTRELTRLAALWPDAEPPREAWTMASLHALQSGSFHSIQWVDSVGHVIRSMPEEARSRLRDSREGDAERQATIRTALASATVAFSRPIAAADGTSGFVTAVPAERGASVVVGESMVPTVVHQLLSESEAAGYSLSILGDGREMYAAATGPRSLENRWSQDVPLGDAPGAWTLRVWPSEVELESRRSRLPEAVFLAGLLFAVGLGGSVALGQTSDRRAHALAAANRRLENEIHERERAQEALQRSEEQLRQSQKMEAVGRLAGGIAHDFNNLLTAISGYADFLLADIERSDPRRDDVREIKKAAMRAAALTTQLLAFSRRQIRQPRALDLNAVLADLEKMLSRVIGEDVRIETRPAERLGTVKADPSDIEQILLNLVVNAGDAMPTGGTISVTTATVAFEGVAAHPRLPQGKYVMLRVSDTGMGMDAATRARIFEPFFTTKGKGTGLGLSTVYAIVEQTGGAVDVDSIPGRGTTFTVYLPQHDEPAEIVGSGTMGTLAPRGVETVLLVEDEDGVRALGARILERHGYTVLEARDGREALAIASRHTGHIDLLLTDVVMPELGGKQLADTLLARDRSLRVLFISGYTDGEISRRGELDPNTAFLQKPFTARSLLGRVRELLDEDSIAA